MHTGPPEPASGRRLPHVSALDGIRALAVLAVMLFHGGVTRAQGGFIGVDVFLVLSGFLITTLLFRELHSTGGIAFKDFWLRRARRLLPALFLVLLAVALFGAFVATDDEALGLRGDLLGSLFYVQNWRLVLSGQSYFAQFGAPSPLRHMWSLAIEEQWYVVWPLLFFGIVKVARRDTKIVALITLALAAGSALLMAVLSTPGGDVSRVYYGTDTRAQALLIGAALAIVLSRGTVLERPSAVAITQVLGLGGLAFLAWVTMEHSETWTRFYRGGLSMVAVAAAAVIAGAMTRAGPVPRILAIPPLPAIGLISYGLYLWHWPVYVLLSPARTGLEGNRLLVVRIGVSFVIAIVSFVVVERPIREQRLRWVRGRNLWIPVASATTAVAVLALSASGASARTRSDLEAIQSAAARAADQHPARGATKVLVAGDSVAFTLTFGGLPRSMRREITLPGVVRLGCGLLTGTLLEGNRRGESQEKCSNWPSEYAAGVRKNRPDLALLLIGAWEVIDHSIDGRVYRVGTPAMEALLRNRLDVARRTLTAEGARLVMLTTPCFSPVQRDLGAFGESQRADPKRVRWLNGVWRRYVRDHPNVTLLDLDAHACPDGRYAAKIHGVVMRTDGVHFTEAGARLMWRWLAPELLRIAGAGS